MEDNKKTTAAAQPVIDSKIPEGPVAEKWTNYKAHQKLVNPANKRRLDIIVVGTGLAGASAASTLAEMGFNVLNFCIQDSPRRAHSIAAQGGINAAKNYQNDGDSVYRLFYDTVKGGDYRAREANVYRLAEVSHNIIDQCVAKVLLLLAHTEACTPTARLVAHRCRVRSMPKDRQVSSSCSVPILRSTARFSSAR